jgi:hypothetical protein
MSTNAKACEHVARGLRPLGNIHNWEGIISNSCIKCLDVQGVVWQICNDVPFASHHLYLVTGSATWDQSSFLVTSISPHFPSRGAKWASIFPMSTFMLMKLLRLLLSLSWCKNGRPFRPIRPPSRQQSLRLGSLERFGELGTIDKVRQWLLIMWVHVGFKRTFIPAKLLILRLQSSFSLAWRWTWCEMDFTQRKKWQQKVC